MDEQRPLGWYPDEIDPTIERLWSGTEWTGSTRAAAAPSEPVDQAGPAVPAAAKVKVARRNLWIVGGVMVVAVLVLGAILVGHVTSKPTHLLSGSVLLFDDSHHYPDGLDCAGTGGYDDLAPGSAVVVTNGSGDVIASGSIDSGTGTSGARCELDFTVDDVPNTAFYGVEVGHRGVVNYSRSDLEGDDWNVTLTIGS